MSDHLVIDRLQSINNAISDIAVQLSSIRLADTEESLESIASSISSVGEVSLVVALCEVAEAIKTAGEYIEHGLFELAEATRQAGVQKQTGSQKSAFSGSWLDKKTINILQKHGITERIADVMTNMDLLSISGVGEKSVRQIRDWIAHLKENGAM